MDITRPHGSLRIYREDANDGLGVELSGPDALAVFVNDVVGVRISGELPSGPDYAKVNFSQCSLIGITARNLDFSECDFKDCLIRTANFIECSFNGGMFATSLFSELNFSRCTFYNLGVHNSDFHNTIFEECDLTNILVKSSQFRACQFERCETSNKVAEMSVLDDTTFTETEIQINTITENFGLRAGNLQGSPIRSGRVREEYRLISSDDLRSRLREPDLSALEKLRLDYFLTGHLLDGSEFLDASLDLGAWVRLYKNPSTFVELLDRFSEFLVHQYDADRLTLHPLLLLHYVTGRLSNESYFQSELLRVAQSIGGTHLILSRIIGEYLEVLEHLLHAHAGRLHLLAESLSEPGALGDQLQPWLSGTGASLIRVVPRNSPLELEIVGNSIGSLLPILAVFLASRTRLEILRYRPIDSSRAARLPPDAPRTDSVCAGASNGNNIAVEKRELPSSASEHDSLFLLDLGFKGSANNKYGLRFKSILPGSLVVDFRLDVSTTLIGKIRKLLVDLIQPASVEGR